MFQLNTRVVELIDIGFVNEYEDWQLITRGKKSMNKTKTTKRKAKWKVGDIVINDNNGQKSKVLAVAFDNVRVKYGYMLQCQDDAGSIHSRYENGISEIEVVKMTVAKLKEYYEENKKCEVIITQKL